MGERNDLIERRWIGVVPSGLQGPAKVTRLERVAEIWRNQGLFVTEWVPATTIASLSEALAEAEKKGAEAYEALTAAQSRLTAIFAIETHSLHVGYDEGSGGGNFVYADVIRTDDPAFVAARDLSQGGQHG